jgi:hypothetical protein
MGRVHVTCPTGVHVNGCPASAPGRYCLAVCYCGHCPHWRPYRLTGAQVSRLTMYLRNPPRYENGAKRWGSAWQADRFDRRGNHG